MNMSHEIIRLRQETKSPSSRRWQEDKEEALAFIRHPSCGAVVTFEGNIRQANKGKAVVGLEYEVYPQLFQREVEKIFAEIRERWQIHRSALIQQVGKLDLGETGIFIVISSPHRREALEALSYAIEEFKRRAPVWKKEYYTDGARWQKGCEV